MVVQDSRIIASWGDVSLKVNVASVRKSLLSALYGIAVSEGRIDLGSTLADLGIDDKPPALTAAEKQATVRDLLMARSGIGQRFKVDTKAEPPVVYILKEMKHAAHFWLGHCENNERLAAFLSEDQYWKLDDEERAVSYLSEFAKTQNERWYDHDFLEAGRETEGATLAERFRKYSWSEIWADELDRRAKERKLGDPNCFVMLGGSPDKPEDWDINTPCDIKQSGIDLHYMGKIEFCFF